MLAECAVVQVCRSSRRCRVDYAVYIPSTGQRFDGNYYVVAQTWSALLPLTRRTRGWISVWNALPGNVNRYELYVHDQEG